MSAKKKKSTAKPARARRVEYKAPALEKGLDIMEVLAGEERGLSISDLAEKLARSVGEIFRMVVVLERREYIKSRPDSDVYVLTQKMFALSHKFRPIARLSMFAAPVLRKLAADTEQSCHMSIYSDGRGLVIQQQDASTESIFSVRLGTEISLFDSCSGHVLLAFCDEQVRGSMIGKIPDEHRVLDGNEIESLVRRVRKKGYESIKSSKVRGVQDIAYPVFDHTGLVVAALTIPFITYLDGSHVVSFERASELAAVAAREISEELGFAV